MARTKMTARIRTMGRLPVVQPSMPTPMVGMHVNIFVAGNNSVPILGTIFYVTPSKRRINVQSQGQIRMFSLRMNNRWLPVGAALHAQDCWLELVMPSDSDS